MGWGGGRGGGYRHQIIRYNFIPQAALMGWVGVEEGGGKNCA